MKKIVALVLSLVMVLGLATTAMAATGGANLDAALSPANTSTVEVKAGLAASADLKTFPTYQVYVTAADKSVSVLPDQYVKVPTAKHADYVVVNGTEITYLAKNPTGAYTGVATAVALDVNADPDCGDVYATAKGTYYLYKGEYYAESTAYSVLFNVDGMAVYAEKVDGTDVKTEKHTYMKDTKTTAAGTVVTAVYCKDCKAAFTFVEGTVADAVKAFGAGNYVEVEAGKLYVAKTASAPVVDGEKVESAETFDAGIAMYVGMSVMAAAGSAVVLKKKD